MSQPTVSIILESFLISMFEHVNQFIYMPRNAAEVLGIKRKLYDVAGFPGILGLIDGTQLPIIAPSEDEPEYVNRKGFHSINCQAICDGNMTF